MRFTLLDAGDGARDVVTSMSKWFFKKWKYMQNIHSETCRTSDNIECKIPKQQNNDRNK